MYTNRWFIASLLVVLSCALMAPASNAQYREVLFTPLKIDGPADDPANDSYWFGPFCETASVLDADGDGDLDIAACRNWYEAPHWIKHPDFRDGAEVNGPETESNSEFSLDVNKDGRPDVVASGWMFMKGVYWYENPGEYEKAVLTRERPDAVATRMINDETVWPSHKVHQAFNMEGVIHGDIDGDGDEDILVNHWSFYEGQAMTWLEHIDEPPYLIEHEVGTEGEVHGNGLGDINMDGRMDIVTPVGWYEQPEDDIDGEWPFHDDYRFKPAHVDPDATRYSSAAAHPFLVHDVNEDGLNDLIIASAHTYGVAWLENKVDANGERSFEHHFVETDYSVFHTMALGDLNGDGKDDLVIGKRMFAHYGPDDGAYEPSVVFWYDIKGGEFERHILSYNHLPYFPDEGGINPAPNSFIGVGMKINIADMDGDGDNDVVLAGKGGLYLMVNQGSPPTEGTRDRLPSYDTYATWRSWGAYEELFNGKDFTGWEVPEGDGGHWKVENFVIDYDALSEAEDKNLWTEEEFCNYNLHIDWRFKEASGLFDTPTILPDGSYKTDEDGNIITEPIPNADSGVFLRGPGHQVNLWNWPVGSGELWTVRNNTDLSGEQRAAAVPKMKADNPIGEWNSMDIKLVGDRVSVMLNGHWVIEEAVISGGKLASTSTDENGNMVITTSPVDPLPECGPIGLQHHGGIDPETGEMIPTSSLVQFRNIWVDPIEEGEEETSSAAEGEWKTLFNGEDLTGWITGEDNKFAVENGELTVKRENPDGREYNLSYLWTEDRYDDFVLELEFKVIEGTNSGVFFRTDDIMDPVYTGLEAQVSSSRSGPIRKGSVGGVYDLQEPSVIAVNPPGEWNTYRLTCDGSRIIVELNGVTTVDMDIARWRTPNMNPDGTWNKFATPGAAFPREGHIGLQDHGRPVWYRNIRIREL